jgi:hypothetical protein
MSHMSCTGCVSVCSELQAMSHELKATSVMSSAAQWPGVRWHELAKDSAMMMGWYTYCYE